MKKRLTTDQIIDWCKTSTKEERNILVNTLKGINIQDNKSIERSSEFLFTVAILFLLSDTFNIGFENILNDKGE